MIDEPVATGSTVGGPAPAEPPAGEPGALTWPRGTLHAALTQKAADSPSNYLAEGVHTWLLEASRPVGVHIAGRLPGEPRPPPQALQSLNRFR